MKISRVLSVLLGAVIICACSGHTDSRTADTADSLATAPADYSADALAWADSVLAGMSLQQQVGQLFMPAVYASDNTCNMATLKSYARELGLGGVVLLKGSLTSARTVSDSLNAWSAVPPFLSVDAENGLAMRFSDAPVYPMPGRMGGTLVSVMYDYGHELARQANATGINVILGPVLDVAPPGNPLLRSRSFGSDPVQVASLGIAYARGIEDGGVMSSAKHFPGHGSATADSHTTLPLIRKSFSDMQVCDLLPFREYVSAGLSSVMVGHLAVPSLDSLACSSSVSRKIINDLLRQGIGFTGLVLTDAMNMGGARGATALDALRAGADIILAPEDTRLEIKRIVDAVEAGDYPADELAAHVRRILFYKYRFCVMMKPEVPADKVVQAVNSESAAMLNGRFRQRRDSSR